MNPVFVNKFCLPEALVELMLTGRWLAPDDSLLEKSFGEPPGRASFYSLEDMQFENAAWALETLSQYLGTPDEHFPPGDIDPQASVLIGDLGHDLPFALDYRADPPRVVFLGRQGDGRWRTVATSVEELIARLELAG